MEAMWYRPGKIQSLANALQTAASYLTSRQPWLIRIKCEEIVELTTSHDDTQRYIYSDSSLSPGFTNRADGDPFHFIK